MKNTTKMMSVGGLILAVALNGYAQRLKTPSYPTSTPTYHAPQTQSKPASSTSSRPTQRQSTSAAQTQSHQTQSQPRPTQTQSHPERQSQAASSSSSQRQHASQPAAAPRPSQKQQARQNKELQKQQQKQQKDNAHQQKEQQKQQKDQARQLRDQQKQQQKQQKEEARLQKELHKQQGKKAKVSAPASSATNSTPRPSSNSSAKPVANAASASAPATAQSQATIQRVNSARSSMSGINRKPLPSGEMTVHSNGRMTLKAENGRQYGIRSNGTIASYSDRTKAASFDQHGRVRYIHTNNIDIHHGAHGQRTIVSHRADGSKVVSTGAHSGYVERRIAVNNKTYIQRTTVINRRAYTTTFIATSHGGLALTSLVPPVFYVPGFYGWAYYPWAAPISFSWGWLGAPWYVGANPYFAATPIYPSASYWLTDYVIGETIAAAYQVHKDAPLGDDDVVGDNSADAETTADDDSSADSIQPETVRAEVATPITMEIKTELAEEVKQELANDNAEAARPGLTIDVLPAALHTKNHVFVVSNDIDVTTADQQLCSLQAGDMLQLLAPAETDASFVQLRVASSKRADCPAGTLISLSLPDLQEMENSFQAKVEAGLEKLNNDQGMAGLPGAPKEAVAVPRSAIEGLTPVSTEDPSKLLDQERQKADEAEAGAVTSAF